MPFGILKADSFTLLRSIGLVKDVRAAIKEKCEPPVKVSTPSPTKKYTEHPVVVGVYSETQVKHPNSRKKHSGSKNCLMTNSIFYNVMSRYMFEMPKPTAVCLYVNHVAI
jgi:hypothetical protein